MIKAQRVKSMYLWSPTAKSVARTVYLIIKVGLLLLICFGAVQVLAHVFGSEEATGLGAPLRPALQLPQTITLLLVAILIRLAISRFAVSLIRSRMDTKNSPSARLPQEFSDAAIGFVRDTYYKRFPEPEMLKVLIGQLIDPAGLFDRITERVDLFPTTHERTTTLTVKRRPKAVTLIPLLAQRKGTLLNDLDVTIDKNPGTTLSFIENQGVVLAVIETLVDSIFSNLQLAETIALSSTLGRVASSPLPVDPTDSLAELVRVKPPGISGYDLVLFEALHQLIEFLSGSFFIFALIPTGDNDRVKVQVTRRTSRGATHRPILDSLRTVMGLRPREHVFGLGRSIETVSYHFSIRTPKGTYIFDRDFEFAVLEDERQLPASRASLGISDYRISPSTKFLHAYIRDGALPLGEGKVPVLRLRLRERPPGLLEVAAALSLILATMVWFVGHFHDAVFPVMKAAGGTMGQTTTAWPTLLFGIPVLLVGWLLTRIDGTSLARTSFTSMVLVVWLGVNAFAAVLAAAFKTSGIALTKEPPWSILGMSISHPIWASIMISTAVHLTVTTMFAVSRAIRYALALTGLTYRYGRSEIIDGYSRTS